LASPILGSLFQELIPHSGEEASDHPLPDPARSVVYGPSILMGNTATRHRFFMVFFIEP
jgi:hypothetical protein